MLLLLKKSFVSELLRGILFVLVLGFVSINQVHASPASSGTLFLPSDYQSLAGEVKQSLLWNNIEEEEYDDLPCLASIPGFKKIFALTNLFITFNRVSDELPFYRKKVIHSFGSVAQIQFVPNRDAGGGAINNYTGIFKGGHGIARLSVAADPSSVGFTPGMAIKFLISGRPSANIHVMNSVNGQGNDTNFFAHDFSNFIPHGEGFLLKALEFWFSVFVKPANKLGLSHLAIYKENGEVEPLPLAPEQIILKPTVEAQSFFPESKKDKDFRIKLEDVAVGTILYNVYDKDGVTKLGDIRLESRFVSSKYGDEKLFFQHQRFTN